MLQWARTQLGYRHFVNLASILYFTVGLPKTDRKKTTYSLFSCQTKQPVLGRLSPLRQWDERQTLLLLMYGIWESWKMSLSMIDMMRESMQKPCCQAIIHPN